VCEGVSEGEFQEEEKTGKRENRDDNNKNSRLNHDLTGTAKKTFKSRNEIIGENQNKK